MSAIGTADARRNLITKHRLNLRIISSHNGRERFAGRRSQASKPTGWPARDAIMRAYGTGEKNGGRWVRGSVDGEAKYGH